jgi:transposase
MGGQLRASQGGDRRSAKTDAHADFILGLVAERGDITLAEMQTAMAERGSPVGIGTLWRFFDRRGITRKKRPGTRSSRTGPTS